MTRTLGLHVFIVVLFGAVSVLFGQTTSRQETGFRQWKGQHSGEPKEKQTVIRTAEEWRRLWEKIHARVDPSPPVPKVDFTKDMIVAVFGGTRRTGGNQIEIVGVEKAEDAVKVLVRSVPSKNNGLATQVITTPYCIAVVPQADKVIILKM